MTLPKTKAIPVSVLAAAACVLVAGCSLQAPAARFSQFGLYFNQDDQGASLAYGRANSDEVGLMLQCDRGLRVVQVTDVARAGRADQLILISGSQRLALPVKLSTDESGIPLAKAKLSLDEPVLQGFRRSGAIDVHLGALRYGLTATRDERAAVANFFAACERS